MEREGGQLRCFARLVTYLDKAMKRGSSGRSEGWEEIRRER